jgi:hypothetical protein
VQYPIVPWVGRIGKKNKMDAVEDLPEEEDDSRRSLGTHLGVTTESKREKAITTYNDDIEEFEEVSV